MSVTLLNLTNHPHEKWPPEQLAAANKFGDEVTVEDLPFPLVAPAATTAQVDALADEIADDVATRYRADRTIIHLSGEYTLTVALVARFQGLGFRVVASTTDRLVSVDAAGDRVIKFQFAQFREYAPLYVMSAAS